MSMLEARRVTLLVMVGVFIASVASVGVGAGEIDKVHSFYFGNSYTGNTMPGLHPLLGESAGKEWSVDALIHPGVPIWLHMYKQMDKESTNYQKLQTVGAETDAIVMLLYAGSGISSIVTEKWQGKVKFDQPTDIGDVAACKYLIERYLKLNPDGRAYMYTAWPAVPGVRELRSRIEEKAIAAAMAEGKTRQEARRTIQKRKPNHEEMEPLRRAMDYAAEWLDESYDPDFSSADGDRINTYVRYLQQTQQPGDGQVTIHSLAEEAGVDESQVRRDMEAAGYAAGTIDPEVLADALQNYRSRATRTHCRKHMYLAMDGLIELFPDLWKEGRLGMVPVGDVFLAFDKKIRAGKVPGLTNIGEYSADGGHLRSGLPRYTLAATYYAVLFKEHPGAVDWRIFQERSNYDSGKYGFYVHQPDLAVHVDITPERAKVLNDTIWEVVSTHPYTGVHK
jgi:hypothetical protein